MKVAIWAQWGRPLAAAQSACSRRLRPLSPLSSEQASRERSTTSVTRTLQRNSPPLYPDGDFSGYWRSARGSRFDGMTHYGESVHVPHENFSVMTDGAKTRWCYLLLALPRAGDASNHQIAAASMHGGVVTTICTFVDEAIPLTALHHTCLPQVVTIGAEPPFALRPKRLIRLYRSFVLSKTASWRCRSAAIGTLSRQTTAPLDGKTRYPK